MTLKDTSNILDYDYTPEHTVKVRNTHKRTVKKAASSEVSSSKTFSNKAYSSKATTR